MFDLSLVPLFLIEHLDILLDLDGPKSNVTKKVPNLNFLDVLGIWQTKSSLQKELGSNGNYHNCQFGPHTIRT